MKKRFLLIGLCLLLSGCTVRENNHTALEDTVPAQAETRPETSVVLSALVADNASSYPGEAGTFPDYLVLRNEGSESETLTGWHLSQKENSLSFTFPSLTLQAGECVTIECDGWNKELHTDFSLKKSGESIYLSDENGNVAWSLAYPALAEDESYTRGEDGSYRIQDASAGYAALPSGLYISEACNFNFSYNGIANEYYDWVELYNASDSVISLSDYSLSDQKDPEDALALPQKELNPGEYCVILCTGSDTPASNLPIHPISLDGEREAIYLRNREGELLDYCSLHDIPLGGSYGRSGGEWVYYTEPTPDALNGSGCAEVSGTVTVSLDEGVYEGVESLEVALSAAGDIRYTLDGSEPSEESQLYTEPLKISSTTVLRARSYETGKCPGRIQGWSYIVNEGHTLPVVSLIADPDDMFVGSSDWPGIYYLPANTIEPELLTDVSFFEEGGGFHAQSTVCLHGATTRESREKKSLKLTFRDAYGGKLSYDLFGDGEESFRSVTLRSGYMVDSSILLDSVCQRVATHTGAKVLGLRDRYCVMYLNGEYWGVYSLREAYSKDYAAKKLNSTEEEVDIVRSKVRSWFEPDMVNLLDYLAYHRVWTEADYERVASEIDLESLADWMVLETYFHNYDLPGNIRYIRANEYSKWIYAFFDLDYGLRTPELDWWSTLDTGNQFGLITCPIVQFSEFQDILFTRMAILFENGLNEETLLRYLDEACEQIESEMERDYQRWSAGAGSLEEQKTLMQNNITASRQKQLISTFCKKNYLDEEEILQRYFSGMDLE